MTGLENRSQAHRLVILLAGIVAIGGAAAAGQAQTAPEAVAVESLAVNTQLAAAVFVPSAEAQQEQATALAAPADIAPEPLAPVVAEPVYRAINGGNASFYGRAFAGRPTASGEAFDPTELTAAHRTLPFGSMVRVTNPSNGRSVVVRINDRGPFAHGREIDVSRAAAEELGMVRAGHARVELEVMEQ